MHGARDIVGDIFPWSVVSALEIAIRVMSTAATAPTVAPTVAPAAVAPTVKICVAKDEYEPRL